MSVHVFAVSEALTAPGRRSDGNSGRYESDGAMWFEAVIPRRSSISAPVAAPLIGHRCFVLLQFPPHAVRLIAAHWRSRP
jgi:hypothetical protein